MPWAVAGSVAVGVLQSYGQQSAAENQMNNTIDLENLKFEHSKFSNQMSEQWARQDAWDKHKWDVQNQQNALNYKEDAIAGFRQFAPTSAQSWNGQAIAPPSRTVLDPGTEPAMPSGDLSTNAATPPLTPPMNSGLKP